MFRSAFHRISFSSTTLFTLRLGPARRTYQSLFIVFVISLPLPKFRPIREFMARKVDFGPHEVKNIADVRIIDLKLRLGQPYLYQHQGKCEHLLVFSDLRLVNASDEQKVDEYPIRVYDTVKQIMCCVCKETVAV